MRPKGVADGQQVDIPVLYTHRYYDGVTEKVKIRGLNGIVPLSNEHDV